MAGWIRSERGVEIGAAEVRAVLALELSERGELEDKYKSTKNKVGKEPRESKSMR